MLLSYLAAGGIQCRTSHSGSTRQTATRTQSWEVLAPKPVQRRLVERCQQHGLEGLAVLEDLELWLVMEDPLILYVAIEFGTATRADNGLAW